jgi:hypothetical protein
VTAPETNFTSQQSIDLARGPAVAARAMPAWGVEWSGCAALTVTADPESMGLNCTRADRRWQVPKVTHGLIAFNAKSKEHALCQNPAKIARVTRG